MNREFIDDQISNFLFTFGVRLGTPNAKRKQGGLYQSDNQ
jgi:hypothetical protein